MARPLRIEFPIADHLRIHFTSVNRILRARDKMLIK
jgi:hypothetical protein